MSFGTRRIEIVVAEVEMHAPLSTSLVRAAIFESGRFANTAGPPRRCRSTTAILCNDDRRRVPPIFGRRRVSLCDKGTRSDDADPVSARWRCAVVSARAYTSMTQYFVIDATQRSTDHLRFIAGNDR